MSLYSNLLGDPRIAACFSPESQIAAMLEVEVALVAALGRVNLIPKTAWAPIQDAARVESIDQARLAREAADAGNLAIPLIKQLTERVAEVDADAARYVHVGATSQDILDTALVIQLTNALPLLLHDYVRRAGDAAAKHADTHRHAAIAGRTWLQQGTPTTFGLKAAGWLDAIGRGKQRLSRAMHDACVLQFGGSTGSLASLGAAGPDVARALGDILDIPVPDLPWHAHRDRLVEVACAAGVLTGTLGKIARDLALLAQTEVAEAYEAPVAGRGGSSAMPHKRNPVSAAIALTAAARVPGLVATMLSAMPQEHERGLGGWQAEWETLPEIVVLTASAARAVADALEGLVVDPARMRHNLDLSGGLIYAEIVSSALSAQLGKKRAHGLVEAASARAAREGSPLETVLRDDPDVTTVLAPDALARCFDPNAHRGAADTFIDAALAQWKAHRDDA